MMDEGEDDNDSGSQVKNLSLASGGDPDSAHSNNAGKLGTNIFKQIKGLDNGSNGSEQWMNTNNY